MTTPVIPARQVLRTAKATNQRLGHEHLGFLSETHGFMPQAQPLLCLPPSHRAWDDLAAQLPELFRSLSLRRAFDRMPLLDASAAALPDRALLRASAIISIFAHAYYYVEPDPPQQFPESILRPWDVISQRLQRPAPHLAFIDLNIYNWKLIDPGQSGPLRVENLELLIPIVGNEDERRFQTTPIEMLDACTPAIGAVIRAQEALVCDDRAALRRELILIADTLAHLAYVSFPKVNPNAYSTQYVNPVVWGKTVAPLATPYQQDGPPGPSGTAIPAFQLLDIFFGRQAYASNIGHETARARRWFPPHWQAFLQAVEQIDVPGYIRRSGDRALQGLFQEALHAYAGDTGLLGRHRLKTYGFLDLSFKAGRSKTLGGFGGGFEDRLWDTMDAQLALARLERYTTAPHAYHHVAVKQVIDLRSSGAEWVRQVVLDVRDTGIRYQPGDRCAILPENSDELVARTLRALRARGDEPIELNAAWRAAAKLRDGYADAQVLPLSTLLTFGRIRPVGRQIAKALYALTHSEPLRQIIEARAEDQWELWDLLDMLAQTGFYPQQLWKARPGERYNICGIVPPERFRMYSISSAMNDPAAESAAEIDLTIGRLAYQTQATNVSSAGTRYGTGSSFLARVTEAASGRRVTIKLVHPPRFSLPKDASRPIVMIAGGTGLAPFRGFLQERARQDGVGDNWLFFGARTSADVYYQDELRDRVAQGQLHVRIAFSQEDLAMHSAGDQLVVAPGRRQRIDAEMLQDANARQLWQLLRSEDQGGLGAYVYVCGRTGFARSVMDAIAAILARFADGSERERAEYARSMLRRLVAEDRYMQEIFTTYGGAQIDQRRTYNASEVVCHNSEQDGYWMIISGRVYDLSEFGHLHPGGIKIIQSYAGMDATDAYQKVLHDANPEVDAMLGMYEIGAVRRLNFGTAWSVAITAKGLTYVTLKDAYRAWISLLYTVVEMENALQNDYHIRLEPVTYDETSSGTSSSPYKLQLLLQTHQRFMQEYLAKLSGAPIERLWALTSGIHSEHQDLRWMQRTIAAIKQLASAQAVAQLDQQISARLKGNVHDTSSTAPAVAWCARLEQEDKRCMSEIKQALRAGVQVFEQLERETIARGGGQLLAAARALPKVLEAYYARLAPVCAQVTAFPIRLPTREETNGA
jgi:sulfite reductase (NADPH) flavoprotein alpha-component